MVGRPDRMRGPVKLFATIVIGALFVVPSSAFAQSNSAQGGYNQPGGVVQDEIRTRPAEDDSSNGGTPETSDRTPAAATATAADEGGNLPFTGLDLAMIVAAGGVLLALGFGIRRATRASTEIA